MIRFPEKGRHVRRGVARAVLRQMAHRPAADREPSAHPAQQSGVDDARGDDVAVPLALLAVGDAWRKQCLMCLAEASVSAQFKKRIAAYGVFEARLYRAWCDEQAM